MVGRRNRMGVMVFAHGYVTLIEKDEMTICCGVELEITDIV